MDKTKSIGEIVRELEQDFISGTGTLMSKYVTTDLYEDINTIYAYLESKHISGSTDSLGREKPFFNIVLAARNIWFRATDIDRKNILLTASKERDVFGALILNLLLHDWMKKEKFGVFLNTWGLELAAFNSSVCKFVEKDGRLISSVTPWSRLIVDQVSFYSNPKIEILELTEAEMYDRGYDKDVIEKLIAESATARETTDKHQKDTKSNYYKLYEIHGKFKLSKLTGKESDKDPVQQMWVVSFVSKGIKEGKEQFDEFTLYKGREEKDPYMLTSLLPSTDGSVSLNGSVKNLFNAQWMLNHTKKAIKDQLDLASKLLFQTSDGNFIGQNALFAMETGDILIHQPQQPLTSLENNSHDVAALQSFGGEWKQLGNELNGVSEAMMGETPKSGTAWRQTESILQESYSLFEIMTENKGLCIEEMLIDHILPFLKKKHLNTSKEISATLEQYDLMKIDKKYVPYEATKRLAKKTIEEIIRTGEIPKITDEQKQLEINGVKQELDEQGNQRFFRPDELTDATWKEVLKDIETKVEITITGEADNTKEAFDTLNTALMTVMNPAYASNPKAQYIINKILTKTGHLSPMELSTVPEPKPLAVPQGGEVEAKSLPVNPIK